MIYNRQNGKIEPDKVYKSRTMSFLYNTTLGGLCVLILRLPIVSRIYGAVNRQKNEHFTRKETRSFNTDKSALISPADSCVLAFSINSNILFSVKGIDYSLTAFLKDETLAKRFDGGTCLIFRLSIYDYHRFCHIDDGYIESRKIIRGFLDTVNLNASGKFTLSSNYREVYSMQTQNFGPVVFVEVGAMLAGRIIQNSGDIYFNKGSEKGRFELGGSSIVLLFKKSAVTIDEDIWNHSKMNTETKVCYGEKIGHA